MENQDLDLIGQTVGNMPYKVGIVDENGKLANQFVVNTSTNRIDIPQAILEQNQLPPAVNLFSGSAVGNILLSGPTSNYDNVQDGLLITLGDKTSGSLDGSHSGGLNYRMDLSSIGLQGIRIPKEQLTVGNSFDISDQLSQYIGKKVQSQYYDSQTELWENTNYSNGFSIVSFGGTTINVLPDTTLNMNLTVSVKLDPQYGQSSYNALKIPVIQVNDYKN